MKYNFETFQDRSNTGSYKYELMKTINSEVSEGIVPLSTADMEFNVAPEIISGLQKHLEDSILGYQIITKEYKEAVVNWFANRYNTAIKPEWITPSAGIISGYYGAVKTITKPGDGVIIMPPVYGHFFDDVESQERVLVRCDLLEEDGRHVIDFEKFEQLAKDKNNKALLFCNPHNPGGRVWTKEELSRLGSICLETNVFIIADEIHADFIRPGHEFISLLNISEEITMNTIVAHGPNKSFNIAGLKGGNSITPNPEVKERYDQIMSESHLLGANSLTLKATELAYTEAEAWLDELLTVIDENITYTVETLRENIPEIKVFDPEGTYLVYMDMSGLGMEEEALHEFLHRDAELFLNLGEFFGESKPCYARINAACPREILVGALERLISAWKRK